MNIQRYAEVVSRMHLRVIGAIVAVTVLSVPVTAYAYTAKTESSDEEYVSKRAAEAAVEAEARNQEQSPSVAVEHSASETSSQEASEGEGTTGRRTTTSECVVPDLRGDSLNRARDVLRSRHCELGRVTRRRVSEQGVLVVVQQEVRAGANRPTGTRVRVTIGVPTHRRS